MTQAEQEDQPIPVTHRRRDWRVWVVTLGGSGLSPVMPGTVGSLGAVLLLAVVYLALGRTPGPVAWNGILIGGIAVYSALCVWLGDWTNRYFGRKDPGPCVLDEGAGICLTALFLPILPGWQQFWVLLAVFGTFRAFDIIKFWPCKQLEKLPAGWGVLVDDLAAAVYANLACQILLRWVIA